MGKHFHQQFIRDGKTNMCQEHCLGKPYGCFPIISRHTCCFRLDIIFTFSLGIFILVKFGSLVLLMFFYYTNFFLAKPKYLLLLVLIKTRQLKYNWTVLKSLCETDPWTINIRCSINTKTSISCPLDDSVWNSPSLTLSLMKAPASWLMNNATSSTCQTNWLADWLTCCLAAFRFHYLQANTQLGCCRTTQHHAMWASNTICAWWHKAQTLEFMKCCCSPLQWRFPQFDINGLFYTTFSRI